MPSILTIPHLSSGWDSYLRFYFPGNQKQAKTANRLYLLSRWLNAVAVIQCLLANGGLLPTLPCAPSADVMARYFLFDDDGVVSRDLRSVSKLS
jgi:hypothetical protein